MWTNLESLFGYLVIISFILLFILYWGEPDLHDKILEWRTCHAMPEMRGIFGGGRV